MSEDDITINALIALFSVSLVSSISVLLYFGIKTINIPSLPNSVTTNPIFQFVYSVSTGVATYFVTNLLFGHGTETATAGGIVSAVIIGVATKVTNS